LLDEAEMSSSGRWTKYQLKLAFNLYCQAGGQTVPHLHIHLTPRYRGDKEAPRGGMRWVLPDKAKYWA